MHHSEYLVCDGTFEMAPNSAYQVYTIHGFVQGESVPLVWAVLPNKTTDTYKELFGVIRSALTTTFGSIGDMKYVLTDFERAAINAVKDVFPEVVVKGCGFIFSADVNAPSPTGRLKSCLRSTVPVSSCATLASPDNGDVDVASVCRAVCLERPQVPACHRPVFSGRKDVSVCCILRVDMGVRRLPTIPVDPLRSHRTPPDELGGRVS